MRAPMDWMLCKESDCWSPADLILKGEELHVDYRTKSLTISQTWREETQKNSQTKKESSGVNINIPALHIQ